MDKITVVVIDDHPMFRQGVCDSLGLERDIEVVGHAGNGESGLALIRSLKPDIAVVDINLPGLNGQQIARQVTVEKLPSRIILLTAYDDLEQKIHSVRSGAAAYCTKDMQPELLIDVVRQAARGKYFLEGEVMDEARLSRWLDGKLEGVTHGYSNASEPYEPLSPREMEVLQLVTSGRSNKEIALRLGISHQTVKNHVTSILRKLNVEDRTQATLYALRRGWVRLRQEPKSQE